MICSTRRACIGPILITLRVSTCKITLNFSQDAFPNHCDLKPLIARIRFVHYRMIIWMCSVSQRSMPTTPQCNSTVYSQIKWFQLELLQITLVCRVLQRRQVPLISAFFVYFDNYLYIRNCLPNNRYYDDCYYHSIIFIWIGHNLLV